MSELLEQFKAAVRRKDWKTAYKHCNGLNMYEMLRGLDSIDRNDLETLRAGLTAENQSGQTNVPRMAYAIKAVQSKSLPPYTPGDLRATGQVEETINFLAEIKKTHRKGPRLGSNGEIPVQYIVVVREAVDIAWRLNERSDFVETFRNIVFQLSGKVVDSGIYATALNNMVIHLADTTTDQRIHKGIADEAEDIASGNLGGATPAFSFRNEPNIWIREFSLAKGVRAVVPHIFHEAAHTVGARGDTLAEFALEVLHQKAGFPR